MVSPKQSPQPSDLPKPSWGPTIVYSHPDGGIVVVGPDKSCAGRLVADVEPGQNGQSYVARYPAFEFAGQGEKPAQSVASLASETLDALFHALKADGNLDQVLSGWARSEQPDIRAAGDMLDAFRHQFATSAHAIFRFCVRDNTNFASADLRDDEVDGAFAVS